MTSFFEHDDYFQIQNNIMTTAVQTIHLNYCNGSSVQKIVEGNTTNTKIYKRSINQKMFVFLQFIVIKNTYIYTFLWFINSFLPNK